MSEREHTPDPEPAAAPAPGADHGHGEPDGPLTPAIPERHAHRYGLDDTCTHPGCGREKPAWLTEADADLRQIDRQVDASRLPRPGGPGRSLSSLPVPLAILIGLMLAAAVMLLGGQYLDAMVGGQP